MIAMKFDTANWQAQLGKMQRVQLATARAMNRTIAQVNTVMVRAIGKDLNVLQATVRERTLLRNATSTHLVATIDASAARIPLYDFKARGPMPSRGRGGGVTARLPPPGAGRYPHAFIARMTSGHVGVFERSGKPRLPIRELFGPSIAQSFKRHEDVAQARADEVLQKNLEHELDFIGFGGGE